MKVTKEVLDGIKFVRESGKTNMFDRPRVIELAMDNDYMETARWIYAHKTEYAKGIFEGFEVDAPTDRN